MQVARRSPQISDANRQWFECYNTRTGARLPYYPEADGHPEFWLTTVPHAPKSSRRTNPKKPDGPIATCRRPRHLLSPKAQAQGNDGPASEAVAGERGTGAERDEFADRKRPVHRRHAAIGAGIEPLAKTRRPLDRRGNLLWCLDALAGDVNDPEQDLLALQKAEQVDRHLGAGYIEACRTIVRRPTWTATATPVSRLARRRERYSSSNSIVVVRNPGGTLSPANLPPRSSANAANAPPCTWPLLFR